MNNIQSIEAPGKSYQRIPYRVLDMRDFEVNTPQSKSYNYKQYMTPIVRVSETGLVLYQNSIINKIMVGGNDTRTPGGPTTYSVANGNQFNFSRYQGNDFNAVFQGKRNDTQGYLIGNVVIDAAGDYYYAIANNIGNNPASFPASWILVGSCRLSNLANNTLGGNIIKVINNSLIDMEFGFAMQLNSNIQSILVAITSSVNWIVLSWQQSWGAVTPLLSDSLELTSGYKKRTYQAVAGELLEMVLTITPTWAGSFTLLWNDDQTYRSIKTLRPNW